MNYVYELALVFHKPVKTNMMWNIKVKRISIGMSYGLSDGCRQSLPKASKNKPAHARVGSNYRRTAGITT